MPRKKLIRTNEFPYHVTSRSNNKEWFYIPTEDVWKHTRAVIRLGRKKFNIKIDAFVLMNNHYHMCIWTHDSNLDEFMMYFNKNLGQRIARQANRINRIFGASYKWTLIESDIYYRNVLKYIYQNPIRAGLVKTCQEYPYSDFKSQKMEKALRKWIGLELPDTEIQITRKKLRRYVLKHE
ncbi:MAG: transposase [Bacteriovoracaceae bacterium]|nr:transposase [Bacteriovoracaceae bacterium]